MRRRTSNDAHEARRSRRAGRNPLGRADRPCVKLQEPDGDHWWRYRRDQFGWTSRSTQRLESRQLVWGSTLFHYGALAMIGGHVVGILIPASVTGRFRISEEDYHHLSCYAGGAAGIVCLAASASSPSAAARSSA
jgi:nitrate reductase gamma subunit